MADEREQARVLNEVFKRPMPEWKEVLEKHREVLDDSFFSNIEERIRWDLEHNHIDDAYRFVSVGDEAAKLVQRPANFRLDLAYAFYDTGNLTMARDLLLHLGLTDPGRKDARYLRARVETDMGNYYDGYELFKKLAEESYERADCTYRMALISRAVGELERFNKELSRPAELRHPKAMAMLEEKPRQDEAELYRAAQQDLEAGRLIAAEAKFKAIVERRPEQVDARLALGTLYYRQDRLPQAVAQFDKATELDADNEQAWRYLGNALERKFDLEGDLDDLKEAEGAYRKGLTLAPEHELLQMELARVEDKIKSSSLPVGP